MTQKKKWFTCFSQPTKLVARDIIWAMQDPDHGVSIMVDGDQSDAISDLLAGNVGTPVYFPSGVYLVEKTIQAPVGSIIVGELWSQVRRPSPAPRTRACY